MASSSLMLIHIGPVQDFIASARRCQDLWFGSYLLSELARAGARAIKDLGGATLIFPGALGDDKSSVANKLLVRLGEGADAASFAQAAQQAVNDRLLELARQVWPDANDPDFYDAVASEQLDELMEFFWVAVPEAGSYAEAWRRAETLLAARKSTRDWGAMKSAVLAYKGVERGVRKSSLDGARESVLDEGIYKKFSPEQRYQKYKIKGSERLSGVDLLKRLGVEGEQSDEQRHQRPTFHSTSHMAAAPLLTRFARAGLTGDDLALPIQTRSHGIRIHTGLSEFAGSIQAPPAFEAVPNPAQIPRCFGQKGSWGYDGVIFFEERVAPDIFNVEGEPSREQREQIDKVLKARAAILKKAHLAGGPGGYYALLLADGDKMGDAIGFAAKNPRSGGSGWERHQALSEALEGFAKGVATTAAHYGGSLIYSGGDDVMALLPLHTALACADRLRQDFCAVMSEALPELPTGGTARPSLSVGLALVHHMTPLDKVRALAKQAEQHAKHDAGRNALGIVMDKRSGVTLSVWGKWDERDKQDEQNKRNGKQPLHKRIDTWAQLLKDEQLPDGVAFELEQVLAPFDIELPGASGCRDQDSKDAIEALARRVIGRKRSQRGQDDLTDNVTGLLHAHFTDCDRPGDAIRALSHEIQVARLFLSAYEVAWGGDFNAR